MLVFGRQILPLGEFWRGFFIRVHRTHLVNKKFIHQYSKEGHGKVKLSNGDLIEVSRRKKTFVLQSLYTFAA
ncbi:MAG: LytTR family DNA-binding domain-containing protein [Bacteroidota bacterium]|nr:LytTR family DNA-binding domain-containing protein [Bacteroidota bacterium]